MVEILITVRAVDKNNYCASILPLSFYLLKISSVRVFYTVFILIKKEPNDQPSLFCCLSLFCTRYFTIGTLMLKIKQMPLFKLPKYARIYSTAPLESGCTIVEPLLEYILVENIFRIRSGLYWMLLLLNILSLWNFCPFDLKEFRTCNFGKSVILNWGHLKQ